MFEKSPIITYNRLNMTITTANKMAETYWACKKAAQNESDRLLWAKAYNESKDAAVKAENSVRKLVAYYTK